MVDQHPRDQIILRAGELFHKRGFAAVTLDQAMAASRVSRAEFHRHFSTKSELGLAWLQRLKHGMTMMQDNFLERPGEKSQRLRKYFMSMRNWLETNGYRSCQFANTASCIDVEAEPDLADLIDEYKRAQRRFFIELVAPLVSKEHAQRIGTSVFLLYSGAITEAQNLKASWPLDDALATAELLCGLHSQAS